MLVSELSLFILYLLPKKTTRDLKFISKNFGGQIGTFFNFGSLFDTLWRHNSKVFVFATPYNLPYFDNQPKKLKNPKKNSFCQIGQFGLFGAFDTLWGQNKKYLHFWSTLEFALV